MTEKEEQLGHLSEIRNLMEKSSRFLSLSGLTGIFAGVYALVGAYLVYSDFNIISSDTASVSYSEFIKNDNSGTDSVILKIQSLFIIGAIVLVLSLQSVHVERFSVFRMQDFLGVILPPGWILSNGQFHIH